MRKLRVDGSSRLLTIRDSSKLINTIDYRRNANIEIVHISYSQSWMRSSMYYFLMPIHSVGAWHRRYGQAWMSRGHYMALRGSWMTCHGFTASSNSHVGLIVDNRESSECLESFQHTSNSCQFCGEKEPGRISTLYRSLWHWT